MARMKKICCCLIVAAMFAVVYPLSLSRAQDNSVIDIEAQGILAGVDAFFSYPAGLIKGRLYHVYADGSSFSISVTGFIGKDDSVFKFSSSSRGEQLRVLYSLGGEDMWIYNALVRRSIHEQGRKRYDRILFTNLAYNDLSGASFQTNFNARIIGDDVVRGEKVRVLELVPILRGGEYSALTMYVASKSGIPVRIEYLGRNRRVCRFLSINKTITRNGRVIPVRFDFLNPGEQTETILRFYRFDDSVHFRDDLFSTENFWKY